MTCACLCVCVWFAALNVHWSSGHQPPTAFHKSPLQMLGVRSMGRQTGLRRQPLGEAGRPLQQHLLVLLRLKPQNNGNVFPCLEDQLGSAAAAALTLIVSTLYFKG